MGLKESPQKIKKHCKKDKVHQKRKSWDEKHVISKYVLNQDIY